MNMYGAGGRREAEKGFFLKVSGCCRVDGGGSGVEG